MVPDSQHSSDSARRQSRLDVLLALAVGARVDVVVGRVAALVVAVAVADHDVVALGWVEELTRGSALMRGAA